MLLGHMLPGFSLDGLAHGLLANAGLDRQCLYQGAASLIALAARTNNRFAQLGIGSPASLQDSFRMRLRTMPTTTRESLGVSFHELTCVSAPLCSHVGHVSGVDSPKEMRRPHTETGVAVVADLYVIGDRAVYESRREAVNGDLWPLTPAEADLPVTVLPRPTHPEPALPYLRTVLRDGSVLVNAFPESVGNAAPCVGINTRWHRSLPKRLRCRSPRPSCPRFGAFACLNYTSLIRVGSVHAQ